MVVYLINNNNVAEEFSVDFTNRSYSGVIFLSIFDQLCVDKASTQAAQALIKSMLPEHKYENLMNNTG